MSIEHHVKEDGILQKRRHPRQYHNLGNAARLHVASFLLIHFDVQRVGSSSPSLATVSSLHELTSEKFQHRLAAVTNCNDAMIKEEEIDYK